MTTIKARNRRPKRTQLTRARARVSPLSQTAEYALRALSQLASPDAGRALTGKELARLTLVPSPYLSKILRKLVSAGLLHSQKGHGGGFVLARPPVTIRLSDVLDAVDEMPSEDLCAFGWGDCDATHPCPLHPVWSQLNDALRKWATSTTLQDVAGRAARR